MANVQTARVVNNIFFMVRSFDRLIKYYGTKYAYDDVKYGLTGVNPVSHFKMLLIKRFERVFLGVPATTTLMLPKCGRAAC